MKGGSVKRYPGTYQEYVEHLSLDLAGMGEEEDAAPEEAPKAAAPQPAKQDQAELKRLRRQVQAVESEMEAAERERVALLESFEREPSKDVRERKQRLDEIEVAIQKAEAAWLELQQRIEAMGDGPREGTK